jgi:hypothetical protein
MPGLRVLLRGDARDPASVRGALGTREFDAAVGALRHSLAQAWRPGS